ncbi:MAG: glycosyltransferase family 4 protein [Verrucomicrobiae bacterium]|nr:glycosyltransferase family 4 protein [Verrucomicrobiae bacterium]
MSSGALPSPNRPVPAAPDQAAPPDPARVEVVAPHFKRRLSGVTSTLLQLVPLQARQLGVATLGPGLPPSFPRLRWWQLPALWRRPPSRPFRIWHARRNIEMLAGIGLCHLLRAPLRLVFTSAAQRHHRRFTRWMIRRMDAVIATNPRSGSFLQVPHTVIRHGVDLRRFHPPEVPGFDPAAAGLPGRFLIGCFGRIRPQKGTDLFVEAMLDLLPQHPDWTAILTGRVTSEHRPFADSLVNRIAGAGLTDRIRFLGEVPEVASWYRRLSLYVAPSRNEGFGLTPLEAMASGVPVVASDAGAYADQIVPGATGAVVPPGDAKALREAIRPYLADPALAGLHGRQALKHVATHFDLVLEAEALRAVYEQLWNSGHA